MLHLSYPLALLECYRTLKGTKSFAVEPCSLLALFPASYLKAHSRLIPHTQPSTLLGIQRTYVFLNDDYFINTELE